jgi:hypothetical protein
MEEIIQVAVQQCLDKGIPVPGSRDEIVTMAFDQKWVKSGAEIEAEQTALRSSQTQGL